MSTFRDPIKQQNLQGLTRWPEMLIDGKPNAALAAKIHDA
jgi:hypothetical protein